jgi:hypothetical protein
LCSQSLYKIILKILLVSDLVRIRTRIGGESFAKYIGC